MSASFRLFVDGITEVFFTQGSLNVTRQIGERGTGSAAMTLTGAKPFDTGDIVTVTRADGTTVIWRGVIDQLSQRVNLDQTKSSTYNLNLVSIEAWASRRRYSEAFASTTLADLITDIVASVLSDIGVSVGTVADVGTITDFRAQLESVDEILRRICDKYGLVWSIDPATLELNIVERGATAAPFDIVEDVPGGKWFDMSLDEETGGYFNRIHVAGWSVSEPTTEQFAGDGERRTFNMSLPIATKPVVEVNGVAQTVGIGDLDTGKHWYWNKGRNEITQDGASTPLIGLDPDNPARRRLVAYEPPITSFTLLAGMHLFGDYLIAGFRDTNGGYVLYRKNGASWEQVNNLRVFTGLQVERIVGFGDYFLSWETDGFDVNIRIYRIVSDTVTFVSTVSTLPTATAVQERLFRQANGKHIACTASVGLSSALYVLIVAPDGTTTAATGVGSGLSVSYRLFAGYHEAFCFVIDSSGGGFSGGTLRQLSIADSVYAITADPDSLTGTFNGGFASTNGYAFFGTSAGIEVYERTGQTATLTKLATITPPSGYTFTETAGTNRFTQMAVYDDWLIVPVDESPYILTYRIDRVAGSVDYVGAYDAGLTAAPRFAVSGAQGLFVGVYDDNEMAGAFTSVMPSETLSVTYRGMFRDLYTHENSEEIGIRATQSGGTGVYESGASLGQDRAGELTEYAAGQIERYSQFMRRVRYSTRTDGLQPGQLQTIELPSYGIQGVFLIERISHVHQAGFVYYTKVEGVIGSDLASWQNYFRQLTGAGQGLDLGAADEVVIPVSPPGEVIRFTETVEAQEVTANPVIGEFIIGQDEIQGEE